MIVICRDLSILTHSYFSNKRKLLKNVIQYFQIGSTSSSAQFLLKKRKKTVVMATHSYDYRNIVSMQCFATLWKLIIYYFQNKDLYHHFQNTTERYYNCYDNHQKVFIIKIYIIFCQKETKKNLCLKILFISVYIVGGIFYYKMHKITLKNLCKQFTKWQKL